MKHYLVTMLTPSGLEHVFRCLADNWNHAQEIAEKAYKEDTVTKIALDPTLVQPPQPRYTAGPWSVDYGESEIFSDTTGAKICEVVYGIDDNGNNMSGLEVAANQHLIAAAPDLLAVVEKAIVYANDTSHRFRQHFNGDDVEAYEELLTMADNALERAAGEKHANH